VRSPGKGLLGEGKSESPKGESVKIGKPPEKNEVMLRWRKTRGKRRLHHLLERGNPSNLKKGKKFTTKRDRNN